LQNLIFTNSTKGFSFSLDAMIAITILTSALFLFANLDSAPGISSSQSSSIVDDTLFVLENTGFIIQTIDTNSPSQSASTLRQALLTRLPSGFDANVVVSFYNIEKTQCALQQDFSSCFPDANKVIGTDGGSAPEDYVSGKKFFLRRQPPGDCNVSFIEFSGSDEKIINWLPPEEKQGAFFTDAFFAVEDVNVTFDVDVTPDTVVVCDQNVTIDLTISVPEDVRKPIDLMLVLDRSGSMSWNGRIATTRADSVWVNGNYAFIDDSDDLESYDVSNPRLPSFLDRHDPGNAVDLWGEGDYVYVVETSGTDQLRVYNASDPNNLQITDSESFQSVDAVFALNDYAYVIGDDSGGGDGLWIVDASNKNNLSARGHQNLSNSNSVFVSGNYAYVGRGGSGVSSVDISNPDSPQLLDTYDPGGTTINVFYYNGYVYASIGGSGIAVINATDPNNLSLADTYNTPGTAYSVYVVNNIVYVADSSSIQILDVSDPNNVQFLRSFATPYSYRDVFVQNDFAYLAAGSMGLITIDTINGPRINNAQNASKLFVDYNGWSLPPDQMGLSSFNTSASLNQELTSTISNINTAIDSLVASGGTDIASGIIRATTELTGANANPNALKFQVVLSDGQSNEGDSASAASDAYAQGIIIYTIGFGADADEGELTAIANNAGGQYYSAQDENALQDVFNIIAIAVGELANNSNVSVPVIGGASVVDLGGGTIVDSNLIFDAGAITINNPWSVSYVLNFPCNSADVCGIDALTFPGPGTVFNYTDSDGNSHSVDFNAAVTVDLYVRDLQVDIVSGEVIGSNDVSLDVLVQNVGELDANSTPLRFYLNDTNGSLLKEFTVPSLCSLETPGCTEFSQSYSSVIIENEGVIYAVINDDNSLSECPIGNIDAVNCYGSPETQIISVDYTVWRS